MKKQEEKEFEDIIFIMRKMVWDLAQKGDKKNAVRWAEYFNNEVRYSRPTGFPLREILEPRDWMAKKIRGRKTIKLPRIIGLILSFLFKRKLREIKIPGLKTRVQYYPLDSKHSCDFCGDNYSLPTSLFCFYPPSGDEIIKVEVCGGKKCKDSLGRYRREIDQFAYQSRLSEILFKKFS